MTSSRSSGVTDKMGIARDVADMRAMAPVLSDLGYVGAATMIVGLCDAIQSLSSELEKVRADRLLLARYLAWHTTGYEDNTVEPTVERILAESSSTPSLTPEEKK
jgi:hypothetical protein